MNDYQTRLIRKAKFFLEDKSEVHIKRFDGFWNGFFIKKKQEDVYLFQERRLGMMLLFLDDVKDIQLYVREEKDD